MALESRGRLSHCRLAERIGRGGKGSGADLVQVQEFGLNRTPVAAGVFENPERIWR